MKIYVPSRARFTQNEIQRGTLKYVPKAERERFTYVVPMDEVEKYQRTLHKCGWPMVAVVGCPEQGIANTRRWIGQDAANLGEPHFCMFDDDLKFYRRLSDTDHRLQYQDFDKAGVEFGEMIYDIQRFLALAAVVGVSPREGNNRQGVGDRLSCYTMNTRLLRAFAFRTHEFLQCEHGRVDVMEDFDVFLQLLEKGYDNINLNYWSQDQAQTSAPGGCSTYRTHAVHEASARKLAELHPGYVALRQKENKTGGAFGTRTEVTISWKKARAHNV